MKTTYLVMAICFFVLAGILIVCAIEDFISGDIGWGLARLSIAAINIFVGIDDILNWKNEEK